MDKLEDQDPVGNRDTSSASEPTIFATSKNMENLQDLEKGTDSETTSEDVEVLASSKYKKARKSPKLTEMGLGILGWC
jgi:hypothetical protein